MAWILLVLLIVPFATTFLCAVLPRRGAESLSVATGALCFVLALLLVGHPSARALSGWLLVDPLAAVFVLPTAFLYLTSTIFAVGYVRPSGTGDPRRYYRRFWAGLNLFAWTMVMAPLINGFALLWIAVEITTVVSALLVALDDTPGATEAAWKYVLIASMGLGVALVATIVMYYAGSTVLGAGFELFYPRLIAAAGRFPPQVTELAFVLAVVGFGTKMGLVPMHTWLPDAHSEAPTPVSALLSAALLAICFYAILRYYEITARAVGPGFPRAVLLAFGLASLTLAALSVAVQRDLKRLLAYSSIEHMGVLCIGMSFAAPLAIVGVLLHVLAHAAAKGTAFFGAGSVVRKYHAKDLAQIRGGASLLPWSGPMLVLAVLALSALPPFGIFRSEFLIVAGGLRSQADVVAAVLVVLVTLAAMGLSWYVGRTLLTAPPEAGAPEAGVPEATGPSLDTEAVAVGADRTAQDGASVTILGGPSVIGTALLTAAPVRPLRRGEPSGWIVVSMVLGLAALTLLGVAPPHSLDVLLHRAAAELEVLR